MMYFESKNRMFKYYSEDLWSSEDQNYTNFKSGNPVATQYCLNGSDLEMICDF